MSKRSTVADIARVAGVGVATVDRVLNGRLPVRKETAERVLAAAEKLGYHGTRLIERRLAQNVPHYRLGFLLQRPDQAFYQDFAEALQNAARMSVDCRVTAIVEFLHSQTPIEISSRLADIAKRVDAIGLVAIDHPAVSSAVAEIEGQGKPVFAMLSDCASGVRRGYIGTDNRKVGRTAAWFLAKTAKRPGEIAVFVGSHRFHGQDMREAGVRSYLREEAPAFTMIETQTSLEDDAFAYESAKELLRTRPNLAGIYVAGGGSEGVVRAFREENAAGKVALVCNEYNAYNRTAMINGIVTALVSTPLPELSRHVVDLMIAAVSNASLDPPGETFLPFDIYILENI